MDTHPVLQVTAGAHGLHDQLFLRGYSILRLEYASMLGHWSWKKK